MNSMRVVTDKQPWYRQPLVWMIIVIPLSAVIGGIITIYLAITTQDGLVADDYYWQGKSINRVLRRDQWAIAHGVQASLAKPMAGNALQLVLQGDANVAFPDQLILKLQYATRAVEDREIILSHSGGGAYQGALPELPIGKWYAQVNTAEWRIVGVVRMPGFQQTQLAPTVD